MKLFSLFFPSCFFPISFVFIRLCFVLSAFCVFYFMINKDDYSQQHALGLRQLTLLQYFADISVVWTSLILYSQTSNAILFSVSPRRTTSVFCNTNKQFQRHLW